MKDYLYIDSNDDAHQARFKVSKTAKVDNLINEKRYDDALAEINRILGEDNSSANLNLKGIILDNLSEFEKSIECFNKAMIEDKSDEIQTNKANAYYKWAKVTFFPEGNYDKALMLIDNALETLPQSEDASEFYFLKAEIFEALNELVESQKYYLIAHKEFDRLEELESQIEYLKNTTDTLINIVGSNFYDFTPETGIVVDLLKQEDNEHDPDAIEVKIEGETVGFVANNPYTLIDEVKSASDIKNIINPNQKAEIQFIYLGEYVIAKLI